MTSIARSAAIRLGRAQRERSRLDRRRRALLYTAASILLVLVMFPFLWLLQMSFRPNDDIFGYELLFTPTLEHYALAVDRAFPGLVLEQRGRQHELDRALAAARRAGRLRALARALSRQAPDRALGAGLAHGAADRLHDPVLPRLPLPRPDRHGAGADHHLPDLQPRAGDLDDADLLRRRAARARGGGLDRRLQHLGRVPADLAAARRARASPRPRCCASSSPGTTFSLP